MKVLFLLFAMCIGFVLALQDALSGLTYQTQQEVIYLNQNDVPVPSIAADTAGQEARLRA